MLYNPCSLVTNVAARKQCDRRDNLRQFPFATNYDPKSHIDVVNLHEQRAIVNCDATALVELIRRGVYTSSEVLTATITLAVRVNDVTNCLMESCLKDGFERAAELDRHLKETGQVVASPLHSLPVSIRDRIAVKGLGTSTGYAGKYSTLFAHRAVADNNALLVDILRKSGVIIYAQTQNPQTLLVSDNLYDQSIKDSCSFQSLETNNNFF